MTAEPFPLALANISAGDYDRAIALLARVDDAEIDTVRIDLARCYVAVRSEKYRHLLRPALGRIANQVDVDRDSVIGPVWHFFRVTAELLSRDDAAGVHVREFAELVDRLSVNADVVDLITELLGGLDATGQADLAAPLHRLIQALNPPEPAGWEAWAELAAMLNATGAPEDAERICDAILERAPIGRTWARAGLTRGIMLAMANDFSRARQLLNRSLKVATDGGWTELSELIRLNLFATYHHAGDTDGLERIARGWLAKIAHLPTVEQALQLARLFRDAGADLLSLDLLSLYADQSWTDKDGAAQLAWLEAMVDVFRALADDFTAAELCLRAIDIDDRVSQSTLASLGQEDYDRIAQAYELLVIFYAELERFDETVCGRTLSYLEAAKEAAFSRALPSLQRHDIPAEIVSETSSLTKELARLEAESERSMRGEFTGRSGAFRSVFDNGLAGIVLRTAQECERERERRLSEIKHRLTELRQLAEPRLMRFSSFLRVNPDSLHQVMNAAPWPEPTVALAYRLDRAESELVTYMVGTDGQTRKHANNINPAALDALLTVLNHYPEEEIDYIAERLTGLLLPEPVREMLSESATETLLISGDASLLAVPWETLGEGMQRLGLDFSLCRTPSLLRTASQVSAPPVTEKKIERALIVANPTGDLPSAGEEGVLVQQALDGCGVTTTMLPSCTRDEFVAALPAHPLVHFAGHTNYLRTDPASSHFLFSDGPLTVADLSNIDLCPGATFILGSCESAQAGQESNRDNSFGIGAILLLNGAAAVIGSNWPARDTVSLEVVACFYSHLLRGGTVSRALQAARRELHRRGEPATTWALFTAMGDPFLNGINRSA